HHRTRCVTCRPASDVPRLFRGERLGHLRYLRPASRRRNATLFDVLRGADRVRCIWFIHLLFAELFPTRLRGTGSGFCYNAGRILTAFFPFAVGWVLRAGHDALSVLTYVALVPLIGVISWCSWV